MILQNENTAAEALLAKYAEILNSADAVSIPSVYIADGLFMPEGKKQISVNQLEKIGKNFFSKNRIQITYSVQNTVVDGGYAFVQATALTKITDLATQKESLKESQDFFVLRKELQDWKIFRYAFNNVKEQ